MSGPYWMFWIIPAQMVIYIAVMGYLKLAWVIFQWVAKQRDKD